MNMRKVFGVAVVILLASTCSWAQSINAAGATFPYPIYSKWFDEYHKLHPSIQINYQSIGSGGGIANSRPNGGFWGFRRSYDATINSGKAGFKILHFPTVLGADVPTYNVPGMTADLKFTPEALAGIFLGKITKWNDPAITGPNPGVKLPGDDIVVVHRSDGSGTTYIWTDYLSKVSAEWKSKVGKGTSVNWPVGLGGKGNEGVSGLIKQTPGSLGYVELIYAIQNNISLWRREESVRELCQGRAWRAFRRQRRERRKPCPTISAFPLPTRPARTLTRSPASRGC